MPSTDPVAFHYRTYPATALPADWVQFWVRRAIDVDGSVKMAHARRMPGGGLGCDEHGNSGGIFYRFDPKGDDYLSGIDVTPSAKRAVREALSPLIASGDGLAARWLGLLAAALEAAGLERPALSVTSVLSLEFIAPKGTEIWQPASISIYRHADQADHLAGYAVSSDGRLSERGPHFLQLQAPWPAILVACVADLEPALVEYVREADRQIRKLELSIGL